MIESAVEPVVAPFHGRPRHTSTLTRPPAAVQALLNREGSPVPCFEFSTVDLPLRQQFAAWHHSFAPVFDFAEPDDLTTGFSGTQLVWDLGELAFARVRTESLNFVPIGTRSRQNPIDHWLVTLMLKGSMTTNSSSRTFDSHAGSVHVRPLGTGFEGCVTDSEMLLLFVPRDFCRDLTHLLDDTDFWTLDHGMGQLLADYMISLARRLRTLDAADLSRLVNATRSMMLACIMPSSEKLEPAQGRIKAVLLERARRFVQINLFDHQLDAASLQSELGVSRSRLYRLFEPCGGVVHYIQHRRLIEAHAALADPDKNARVIDIAEQHGFNDGAEFSRAFKRKFGYSPSAARASGMIRPPSSPRADLHAIVLGDRLSVLLRRLQS